MNEIGVGVDHRTIRMDAEWEIRNSRGSEKKARRRSNQGWAPADADHYKEQVSNDIRKLRGDQTHGWIYMQAEGKCKQIEELLLEAAERNKNIETQIDEHSGRGSIRGLIMERRTATSAGSRTEVKRISKQLRKELRAIDRAKKRARICKLLEEFKDIKSIVNIRTNNKARYIGSVVAADGEERHDRRISRTFLQNSMRNYSLICMAKLLRRVIPVEGLWAKWKISPQSKVEHS